MIPAPIAAWADAHPWPATAVAAGSCLLLLVAAVRVMRRAAPPGAALVAGFGAAVCTAYSADTSWGFAQHRLDMTDPRERLAMFAAAEIALLSCALLARANKRATATATNSGTAGVPGALVWVITGVQIIPAFTESGFWGGLVRAVIGPVMAGLLWHQAMGLEVRIMRPGALSTGLPAVICRELRERLLSRLGLAVRDRSAEQISRDRARDRAVRLASLLALHQGGMWARSRRRRLRAALRRAHIGSDGAQRHHLMRDLGVVLNADSLPHAAPAAPWGESPAPEQGPATLLGLVGALLRQMHPVDAVHLIRDAHSEATPAEVATELTRHGVAVSETQVRIALRERPDALPDAHPRALRTASAAGQHRHRIDVPLPPDDEDDEPEPGASEDGDAHSDAPEQPDPDPRIAEARALDKRHRAAHNGRPASQRALQREMRIGQDRAKSIRRQLDAAPKPATTDRSSA